MSELIIIPDNETDIDLLYYEAIAGTIVELLASAGDEPLTIGVHGDWGAGKSSILKMLEKSFSDEDRTLCIRFNGWLFQGFEDTKAVLIETIVEELKEKRSLSGKALDKAKSILKRVDMMKVARKAGGLAFTVATGLPTIDQAKDIIAGAKAVFGEGQDVAAADVESFLNEAGGYFKEAEPESIPTQIHAFREEFIELLALAQIDRLIVVVDDLDRCLPETAIETLEAIRLFLFVPGAAFVIAADEAMIEYAVKKHFPDLPLAVGPSSYARNYLEKLIQVPFRLPPLGYVETRTYITLLNAGLHLAADDDAFIKLIGLTKEVLKRPWGGDGFDRETIKTALGAVPQPIEAALQLADQIAPLLAEGSRGNPRQIKRFLNTMNLRLAIAEQRGIGADVNAAILAKLMLAERFATDFYDDVEREASIDGHSAGLKALEALAKTETEHADDDAERSKETAALETKAKDWASNGWVRRWVQIEPLLADVDLRPYLFVSRDRKAVFSSTSALAVQEALVEKLCGSQLGARAAALETAAMPANEAEQVFNAIARRVSSATDLVRKPPGVDGLTELCKVHPALQVPTVALLGNLPVSKIGAWAPTGWRQVITESSARSEFDKLIARWAGQDDNKILKTAAAKSAPKKGR